MSQQYTQWPTLVDLCADAPISGLAEMRKGALMSINREDLIQRMRMYYDPNVDWETLKTLKTGLTEDGGRFDAKAARTKLQDSEKFDESHVRRYALYPFDLRWCYHSTVRPLWNEPRSALSAQSWDSNTFVVTRMMAERPQEQITITATSALPDYHLLRPNAVAIPIRIRRAVQKKESQQNHFFSDADSEHDLVRANLSSTVRTYLTSLDIADPDADKETAALIWMHALAIGYSPAYLNENADGIRSYWPRIPLPSSKEALLHSAALGRKVSALLDTERGVAGVTEGKIEKPLDAIGVISRVDSGQLQTEEDELKGKISELRITAGWGHGGKGGITMPGKGKLSERDYTPAERGAITESANSLGVSPQEIFSHLGEKTFDVYLNEVAYWRNIPARVWDYTIGGYQVIKKWLSYREHKLLGRPLTTDEAREVMNIARRIASILLLEPSLRQLSSHQNCNVSLAAELVPARKQTVELASQTNSLRYNSRQNPVPCQQTISESHWSLKG